MDKDAFIVDTQLANFLRHELRTRSPEIQQQLKSVMHCGSRFVPVTHMQQGVVLLSNGQKSTFSGIATCDNLFCCPYCQGRRMMIHHDRIKVALDEMHKLGYRAFMATFTFPHLRFLSCRDGVRVLAQMKKNFLKKQKGTLNQNFLDHFGIKHYVWCAEFTHSKHNGWHPHYHTIFWVKENFEQLGEWEEKLKIGWLKSAKNYMLQILPKWKVSIEKLFKLGNHQRGGVFFSKDLQGNVREVTSGNYCLGWTTSKEVTQLEHKTAAEGHYTTRQLLERGYQGHKESMNLYIEFCLAVKGVKPSIRRVQYSAGLVKMIKSWQQQQKLRTVAIKKKENFQPVLWFTPEQWRFVYYETPTYTMANILYLARLPNLDLLFEFLDNMNIAYSLPDTNPLCQLISDAYNAAA